MQGLFPLCTFVPLKARVPALPRPTDHDLDGLDLGIFFFFKKKKAIGTG